MADYSGYKSVKATWKDGQGKYHCKWTFKSFLQGTKYTVEDISNLTTVYDILHVSFKDGTTIEVPGNNPNAHKRSFDLKILKS